MGVVYLALDPILQRLAAIKVLSPHLSSDETVIARFINEARIAASLQHPNIVTVYEAGQDGEFVFMAMEYVEGQDLATLLRERGRLHPDEAIAILKAIASALDYAHQRGVIHRDVKPSNVLVSRDGVVKLMDFGIARVIGGERHTKTGVLVGTPEYMAPELWEGKEADKMADLYALGVMAYEMLTGEVPFTGDTPIAVGYKHVHGEVPRTGMGGMVDEVMKVAMAKERERRFQSGMALVMALEKALERRQEGQRRESFDAIERRHEENEKIDFSYKSQSSLLISSTNIEKERKFIKKLNLWQTLFAFIIAILIPFISIWISYEMTINGGIFRYYKLSSQSSQPIILKPQRTNIPSSVSPPRIKEAWIDGEECEYCGKKHGKVFILLSNGIIKKLTDNGVDPKISKDGYKVGWLEKEVTGKEGFICIIIGALLYDLRKDRIIKEWHSFEKNIPQWVKELWGEDVY
jgi:serine/threonine-protein kinase